MVRLIAVAALGLAAAPGVTAARAAPSPATPQVEPLYQFKHVSWPMERGAPSRIDAITQSKDGYLWIGSVDGLFRFDGVSFELIPPDSAEHGSTVVAEVLGARSGEVWAGLGRSGGVAVYRGGRLVDARMPNPSREVTGLAEDAGGAIWVARGGRRRDTLARYDHGKWLEIGADWNLPQQEIWQILFARDGTMWLVLNDTVVRRRPGVNRFEPTGVVISRRASLAEDADGRIWLSDRDGTRILQGGASTLSTAAASRTYPHADRVGGTKVFFDRRGDLWGATWTDGVFQIAEPGAAGSGPHAPLTSTFKAVNGLTSDQTHALFEDREGNIWIGTELGLDMLRPAGVVVEPSIPANSPRGYLMASTPDGVIHIQDDRTLYDIAPGQPARPVAHTDWPGSVCAGRGNSVWVLLRDTMLRVEGGHAETLPKPAEANSFGCAEDRDGRLWMAGLDKGLYWREGGAWKHWPEKDGKVGLPANAATTAEGKAAVLFRARPAFDGAPPIEPLYKERFQIGGLEGVLPGLSALYVSGARGMVRLRGGRIATLDAQPYPWLASVNGLVQTAAGDTWTIGDAGIIRMRTADLDAAFDRPGRDLPHQVIDFRDGLNSFAQKAPGAQAAVGGDGKVWFLTRRNVVRIDPAALTANRLAPPVAISAVTAGDHRYRDPSRLTLPAGTTNLTIDYTALSLAVPSRVQFRYRLGGIDRGWVEAGARRQVIYSDLRPGTFRFRVVASNNDGVWNETGATLTVVIPPTLYQTWLFRGFCAAAAALLLWGLYSLRLRQVAGQIRARLEERTAERERIARELHDTLLQSVQGLTMRFQSVADHIAEDHPARAAIDKALDRADLVLVEGRDRVRDLRRPDPRRLDVVLREMAQEQPFAPTTRVEVISDGAVRTIRSLVMEEIARIGGEALFNAALHAEAKLVQVRISYSASRLQVVFRDDGVGIGAKRLAWAGREGHYGLIGMQERAKKMGAQLSVESAAGEGTAITLSLGAAIAYERRGEDGSRSLLERLKRNLPFG